MIGGLLPQCQTGQSVAALGYVTVAIIIVVGTLWVLGNRTSP
jgi:hypothetical protein